MQLTQWHKAKFDSSQNVQGLSRKVTQAVIPMEYNTLSEAGTRSSSEKNFIFMQSKIHSWKSLSLDPVQFVSFQLSHLKAKAHIQDWTATVLCRTAPRGRRKKPNLPCRLWHPFQFTHTGVDWYYTALLPWQINFRAVRGDTVRVRRSSVMY